MPVTFGELTEDQYRSCLACSISEADQKNMVKLCLAWIEIMVHKLAYAIFHDFTFPTDLYLFHKFQSHVVHQILNDDEKAAVKRLLSFFKNISGISQEIQKIEEMLNNGLTIKPTIVVPDPVPPKTTSEPLPHSEEAKEALPEKIETSLPIIPPKEDEKPGSDVPPTPLPVTPPLEEGPPGKKEEHKTELTHLPGSTIAIDVHSDLGGDSDPVGLSSIYNVTSITPVIHPIDDDIKTPMFSGLSTLSVGDFNHDSAPDLIVGNPMPVTPEALPPDLAIVPYVPEPGIADYAVQGMVKTGRGAAIASAGLVCHSFVTLAGSAVAAGTSATATAGLLTSGGLFVVGAGGVAATGQFIRSIWNGRSVVEALADGAKAPVDLAKKGFKLYSIIKGGTKQPVILALPAPEEKEKNADEAVTIPAETAAEGKTHTDVPDVD